MSATDRVKTKGPRRRNPAHTASASSKQKPSNSNVFDSSDDQELDAKCKFCSKDLPEGSQAINCERCTYWVCQECVKLNDTAFPWSSFRLLRPWSQRDANQYNDEEVFNGTPNVLNDDGRSRVNDHFFTEPDGDEYSRRTLAERRSALKRVSDQLLLAEINAEIWMIDERIHALCAVIHHSDQGPWMMYRNLFETAMMITRWWVLLPLWDNVRSLVGWMFHSLLFHLSCSIWKNMVA